RRAPPGDGARALPRARPPRGDRARHPAPLLARGRGVAGRGGRRTELKITSLRTTVVGAPWRELVFLELTTDNDLTGTAEVRMVNKEDTLLACIDELAPRYVVGSDPFDVERLAWIVTRGEYGRAAVEIVTAVRQAVGPDVQIMVEMHGRFTPATAAAVAVCLEPCEPEWLEEPVQPENAAALRRVREATRLAIATGERAHTMADI